MPRKVRQLITDLKLAGFFLDRQKGSHRQFKHAKWLGVVTISGGESDDAQRYQEKQVAQAIEQTRKK